MIANGTYRAKALSGALGESKKKGTPYVLVDFEVLDDGPHKGHRVQFTGYFTDATSERTIDALRNVGCTFPADDLTDLSGLGDREASIVVEAETYEGKTYPKVKWVNRIGGMRVTKPIEGDNKRSFAVKMKGAVVAAKAAEKARVEKSTTDDDDDIAF